MLSELELSPSVFPLDSSFEAAVFDGAGDSSDCSDSPVEVPSAVSVGSGVGVGFSGSVVMIMACASVWINIHL